RQERTEWHRIVVWGKQAEIVREHLSKGKQVYVEGSIQTRQWDDREGNKRQTTEIKALRVLMLGRPEPGAARMAAAAPASSEAAGDEAGPPPEDDIPFCAPLRGAPPPGTRISRGAFRRTDDP